jgi:uncharacterized protein (DUF2235 family)
MKRLVLCCDGTWNREDQEKNGKPCPTNVVKLAYRIAKRDAAGTLQIIYYDHGVGTGNFLDHFAGGASGDGLEENIHDAFRFLIANYEPGDEIYLFGFSRGAFTARSIAGMVRKCGILKRESVEQYRRALELYRSAERPTDAGPRDFRKSHSVCGAEDVKIKMIGVWDTVGALGVPLRGLRWVTHKDFRFHDTELSGAVEYAFHALSVDEQRAPFEPTLWYYKEKPDQHVEQVWFCGVHSDVGGGYVETDLSDIALQWMMEKAKIPGLGFDQATVLARPTHGNALGKLHNSKTNFYRVTPGSDREIGVKVEHEGGTKDAGDRADMDPTQTLHPTVRERWDRDKSYRPDALKKYFKRTADPRAGQ